jgi:dihydroorotase
MGSLRAGTPAHLTLIDPEEETVIDVDKFRSKARNCPFAGWRVKGRVLLTIVDGVVRYSL